jgi:hypothetical protein
MVDRAAGWLLALGKYQEDFVEEGSKREWRRRADADDLNSTSPPASHESLPGDTYSSSPASLMRPLTDHAPKAVRL